MAGRPGEWGRRERVALCGDARALYEGAVLTRVRGIVLSGIFSYDQIEQSVKQWEWGVMGVPMHLITSTFTG